LAKAPESERERTPPGENAEFRERFANPFVAAERGYIDAVIEPADTRRRIVPPSTRSKTSATPTLRKNTATLRYEEMVDMRIGNRGRPQTRLVVRVLKIPRHRNQTCLRKS